MLFRSKKGLDLLLRALATMEFPMPTRLVIVGEGEASARAVGQHQLDGAAQLDENMSVTPAPGHTPGTIAIKFESKGEKALFCGDILHHALQIYAPQMNSKFCELPAVARTTRARLLALPWVALASAILLASRRLLEVLSLGDLEAASLGAHVTRDLGVLSARDRPQDEGRPGACRPADGRSAFADCLCRS